MWQVWQELECTKRGKSLQEDLTVKNIMVIQRNYSFHCSCGSAGLEVEKVEENIWRPAYQRPWLLC
jgi:hypothetical protein